MGHFTSLSRFCTQRGEGKDGSVLKAALPSRVRGSRKHGTSLLPPLTRYVGTLSRAAVFALL